MNIIDKHNAYTILKPRYKHLLDLLMTDERQYIFQRIRGSSLRSDFKNDAYLIVDALLSDLDNCKIRDFSRKLFLAYKDVFASIIRSIFGILYVHIMNNYPGDKFPEKFYNYINNQKTLINCKFCRTNLRSWKNKVQKGYSDFCSITCCNKDASLKDKRLTSYMKDGIKIKQAKDRVNYMAKHGCDSYFKTQEFKKKYKLAFKHRGGENPMHVPEIANRVLNKFKTKTMVFQGREIKYKGYENVALDLFDSKNFKLNDDNGFYFGIINVPRVRYQFLDKIKTYYCDAYIPKSNLLVEVKSDWTFKYELKKNVAKHNACLALGFNHEFWICSQTQILNIIPSVLLDPSSDLDAILQLEVSPKKSLLDQSCHQNL